VLAQPACITSAALATAVRDRRNNIGVRVYTPRLISIVGQRTVRDAHAGTLM